MLRSGSFLTVREGLLGASAGRGTERLRSTVEQVIATGQPTAFSLQKEHESRIDLSVSSVPNRQAKRLALILVSGAIESDSTRSTRLRAMYGLSAGEASLAGMLADGMSPAEIAEVRSVSIGTVRIQIKQIAFKLGCSRQAEIVRAVCSLPPLRDTSA